MNEVNNNLLGSGTKRWLRSFAIMAAVSYFNSPALAETALVVSPSGLSGSVTFGEIVEVEVSSDGASVSLGGEGYPRGYVALEKDGCFEVGLSQGSGSVFEDPEYEGTGHYNTVKISSSVSASLSAGVKICPILDLGKPLLLEPLRDQPTSSQSYDLVQRMAIPKMVRKEYSPGDAISEVVDAICLDRPKQNPALGTKFGVAPSMNLNLEVQASLAMNADFETIQDCSWLAEPETLWRSELRDVADESGTEPTNFRNDMRQIYDLESCPFPISDSIHNWTLEEYHALKLCTANADESAKVECVEDLAKKKSNVNWFIVGLVFFAGLILIFVFVRNRS